MKVIRRIGVVAVLTFCLSIPPVMASNGLILIGYGAKSRGMGGSGLALTEDALVTAINPAGASNVDNEFDVGLLIFNPQRRAACCLAPEGEISDKNWFFIPNMAATYKLNDNLTAGFGFVGYGGGRTQYSENLFTVGAGKLGVELSIAMMSPTLSYRLDDEQSVGVSLLISVSRFRALGLDAFKTFTIDPNNLTDKGYDYAYGAGLRIGWLKSFNGDLSLAAVYQTEVNQTKFDLYRGLFPEQGNFDLPAVLSLGLAVKTGESTTVSFDWQRVFYENVAAIGNRTLPVTTLAGSPDLMGQDDGPGFGWENQDVYKLGVQYQYSPAWVLRAGVNYGKSPIRNDTGGGEFEVNVLAPAVTEWAYTGGLTYASSKKSEWTLAFMYSPLNTETQNLKNSDLPYTNETIELEMKQYAFDIGYGYKF